MKPSRFPVEGDLLPAFQLTDQAGRAVQSKHFLGKRLVLYFYPRDETPGCTREACHFQEGIGKLEQLGAQVVGVSADSAERHRRFADKHGLTFPLLVDADRAVANAFGVVGEKTLYGKTRTGVIRSTFIVDEQGTVRRVFRNVKVEGHLEEVVAALRELGSVR